MVCPHCQTSNADGAKTCASCRLPLQGAEVTLDLHSAGPTSSSPAKEPTRGSPRPTPGSSLASMSVAPTLPEGFELSHRYRVIRLLGRGGMGAVYQVRDLELDRDVALKILRSDKAMDEAQGQIQATYDKYA